ncbi:MAG: ATP cone domain-containing protein [Candidatus Paceibacterota bacterium]|jgi:transcriptional regulator NrdR family protein
MAKQVIKSNGSKIPFDGKKISKAVSAAAGEANLPPQEINRVVEQVSALVIEFANTKDKLTTMEIREKTLMELDRLKPEVSVAWRKYDESRK